MKSLRHALENYLTMRRGLGFKLEETETQLAKFVLFMQTKRATFITNSLALEWATIGMRSKRAIEATDVGSRAGEISERV